MQFSYYSIHTYRPSVQNITLIGPAIWKTQCTVYTLKQAEAIKMCRLGGLVISVVASALTQSSPIILAQKH
jgi:hypothetical protein